MPSSRDFGLNVRDRTVLIGIGLIVILLTIWAYESATVRPVVVQQQSETCALRICNKPNADNVSTYCVTFPYMNVTDCPELDYICTYKVNGTVRWDEVLGMNCTWKDSPELVCECMQASRFVDI